MGNLAMDMAGNLYGTTAYGGSATCGGGCGVVYKLARNPGGTWTYSVLHRFGGADGSYPEAGVIFDRAGNLYGTTYGGGARGVGVVFKLAHNPNGTWTESVLHSFAYADGAHPFAGLIFDAAGNLYGTTSEGGSPGNGVVFMLTHNLNGTWTESVLHRFLDGACPEAELTFDAVGNLYGTTANGGGGGGGAGTVFELKHNPDGTWTETLLYTFTNGADGANPLAAVTFNATGDLFGTTFLGGAYDDGLVFRLARIPSGWSKVTVYTFTGYGRYPVAPVIFDRAGNLFSTVSQGTSNNGLVFEIIP